MTCQLQLWIVSKRRLARPGRIALARLPIMHIRASAARFALPWIVDCKAQNWTRFFGGCCSGLEFDNALDECIDERTSLDPSGVGHLHERDGVDLILMSAGRRRDAEIRRKQLQRVDQFFHSHY